MSELNETFSIGSKYIYKQVGINFRNQPVLQDFRMTLGGQVESSDVKFNVFFMQVSLQVAGFCRFLQVSCKFLEFKKLNLQKTLHGDNLHFDISSGVLTGLFLCITIELVSVNTENFANLFPNVFKTYTESFIQL